VIWLHGLSLPENVRQSIILSSRGIIKIKKSWFFFILFALAFLYSNLMRISGVVILPPLAKSLGISASMVGFLSTLFFYTYGAAFAVWGTIADRIGAFRTCGISPCIPGKLYQLVL
jgi:sugar phosphate permease